MINKGYKGMTDQLQDYFIEHGSISLQEFLDEAALKVIREELARTPFTDFNIPMEKHHLVAHLPQAVTDLLDSEEMKAFIGKVISAPIKRVQAKAYAYTHESFVLRHTTPESFIFFLDISTDWEDGNGGDVCLASEEDTLVIPPTTNTITIAQVDEGIEQFITYSNHYTTGTKRLLIKGKFIIEE